MGEESIVRETCFLRSYQRYYFTEKKGIPLIAMRGVAFKLGLSSSMSKGDRISPFLITLKDLFSTTQSKLNAGYAREEHIRKESIHKQLNFMCISLNLWSRNCAGCLGCLCTKYHRRGAQNGSACGITEKAGVSLSVCPCAAQAPLRMSAGLDERVAWKRLVTQAPR